MAAQPSADGPSSFALRCAGFARYFGMDPVAARVLYVLLTFVTGGALVLGYVIFWILMPEEPAVAAAPTWPTDAVPPPAA